MCHKRCWWLWTYCGRPDCFQSSPAVIDYPVGIAQVARPAFCPAWGKIEWTGSCYTGWSHRVQHLLDFLSKVAIELHTVVSESSSALTELNKWFFSPKSLRAPDSFAVELLTPVFQIWNVHTIYCWSYFLHIFHNICENDRLKTQSEIIPFSLKYMLGLLCFRREMFVFAQTSLQDKGGYQRYQNTLELFLEGSLKAVAAGAPVLGSVFVFGPSCWLLLLMGRVCIRLTQVAFSDSSDKHAQRYRERMILQLFFSL